MKEGHKFKGFIEFNSYKDIGFFYEDLLIEACVKIAFVTTCDNKVFMNLMLIDPYHEETQFALFTSSHIIKLENFQEDDLIEKIVAIPSKRNQELKGRDKSYKVYLISQYKRILNRSKFVNPNPNEAEEDSDFGVNFMERFNDDS